MAPAAAYGAFPGSNGRIFFDTGGPGRDIVSVDPQGGDRTKVTQGQEPAVSPNGRLIAFVRRGDIYMCNKNRRRRAAGHRHRRGRADAVVVAAAATNSSSQPIAATASAATSSRSGRRQRSRAPDRERARGLQPLLLAERQQDRLRPCFQPPGRPADLQDGFRRVQSSPAHFIELPSRPSIRPGRRTATGSRSSASSTARCRSTRSSPTAPNELQLTFGEDNRDREPAYSPSGNKIVYRGQDDDGDGSGLFVIPAIGGPRERLTAARASGVDADPYWGSTP